MLHLQSLCKFEGRRWWWTKISSPLYYPYRKCLLHKPSKDPYWLGDTYAGVCTVLLSLPGDSTCALASVVRLTDKCPSLACAELLNSLSCVEWLPFSLPYIVSYLKLLQLLERAWASLTLAGLHCKTCVYVCLLTVWPYIPKIFIVHFKFVHPAKAPQNSCSVPVDTMDPSLSDSTPTDLLNATEDSSPCNSMLMNLLSARTAEQPAARQAWNDAKEQNRLSSVL